MGDTKLDLCDPYVWEDPRYLFRFSWMKEAHQVCFSEYVNQLFFIYGLAIFLSVGTWFVFRSTLAPLLFLLLATVYLYPVFRILAGKRTSAEGFKGAEEDLDSEYEKEAAPSMKQGTTWEKLPTARNPMMNPMLYEITGDETNHAPSASVTEPGIKLTLDDFFRVQVTSDPTDVYGRTQSQRQFYTVPGSSIPNDQGSYQNWLYKIPGKTCKEGGRENCLPGTNGAAIPWLNQGN